MAVIAVSRWTNRYLCRCCVSARGALDDAPIVQLDSEHIILGGDVSGAMTCCCGNGEEDDNKKWKVLRTI